MVQRKFREYEIPFVGLKQGKHTFEYDIDEKFFELFGYHEFNEVRQKVQIVLDKKSSLLDLSFKSEGVVGVNCDITDEAFDLPTEGELHLVVKFGEEFNDEDDELLVIPNGEHSINVAQYIYEMIVLSVPAKRIHPDVEKGNFHPEIIEKLEELAPKCEEKIHRDEEIDPRWNELKKLLN